MQITYSQLLDIVDNLNENQKALKSNEIKYTYTMENNKKMYTITVFWNESMLCGTSRWDFEATRIK